MCVYLCVLCESDKAANFGFVLVFGRIWRLEAMAQDGWRRWIDRWAHVGVVQAGNF